MEDFILDTFSAAAELNYDNLFVLLFFLVVVVWLLVVSWVYQDARSRSTSNIFIVLSVVLVLPFNIIGLLIYLSMRPGETTEEIYWSDLERRLLIHETTDLDDCTECGFQLRPEFNSCPKCGTHCKVECGECQSLVKKQFNFCPYCNLQLKDLQTATDEPEISKAEMEKRVEQVQEQVNDAIGKAKNKYRTRKSFYGKLGASVIAFWHRMYENVVTFFNNLEFADNEITTDKSKKKSKKK